MHTDLEDYMPTTLMLDFSSSVTRFEVQIPIVNDDIYEETERFFARLTVLMTGVDVLLSPDSASITIFDNDGMSNARQDIRSV